MPHARIRTSYDLGPEGRILIASLEADPAAGAEVTVVVPGRAVWDIVLIHFALDTDGTAATRFITLVIDDGERTFLRTVPQTTASANQDWAISYGADLAPSHNASIQVWTHPIPRLRLLPGWRIRTVTSNLQAGDNYTAPVIYLRETPQRGIDVGQDALRSALRRLIGEEAQSG